MKNQRCATRRDASGRSPAPWVRRQKISDQHHHRPLSSTAKAHEPIKKHPPAHHFDWDKLDLSTSLNGSMCRRLARLHPKASTSTQPPCSIGCRSLTSTGDAQLFFLRFKTHHGRRRALCHAHVYTHASIVIERFSPPLVTHTSACGGSEEAGAAAAAAAAAPIVGGRWHRRRPPSWC